MSVSLVQPVASTLEAADAAEQAWQALIVGAGPAGCLAARELALRGCRVLLVDKGQFPRPKVCGGCLGAAALALLDDCGLGALTDQLGAPRTEYLRLLTRGAQATLRLTPGASVSREAFDAAMLREAIAAGAHFLDGATARLAQQDGAARRVRVRKGGRTFPLTARVILAADGLAGGFLRGEPELTQQVSADSRIGLGACIECDVATYASGSVFMVHAPGGYVGLVRVEGHRLNLAAAMDAHYVRAAGGPAAAVLGHLRHAGLPEPPELLAAAWLGAPALTRRRSKLSAEHVLVIGDAAGYIEPFTGEGMTWALMSAWAVIEPSLEAIEHWTPRTGRQWEWRYRRLMQRRKWICQALAALLRRPRASAAAVRLLALFPWLARPAMRQVNRRFRFR